MDGGGDEARLCSLISLFKTDQLKLSSKSVVAPTSHPTVQDIESPESYPDCIVETVSGTEKHNIVGTTSLRPQHPTVSSPEITINNKRTAGTSTSKQTVLPPKSCLTRLALHTSTKPNQKKKTVAFGKTVNVSQTIEGTSRPAKHKADMSKNSKTAEVSSKENRDPTGGSEDQQKLSALIDTIMEVKESVQTLIRQGQEKEKDLEILKKEKEEMNQQILETKVQMEKLGKIFADYMEISSSPDRHSRERERFSRNINSRKNERMERGKLQYYDDGRYDSAKNEYDVDTDLDSLTLAELKRLMETNPAFRQYVADIRAEEREDRKNRHLKQNKPEWDKDDGRRGEKCLQRNVEREGWQKDDDDRANGRRGATITQKFTVERSIRCSPSSRTSPYSVDTRRFLADEGILHDADIYDDVQSIYQPGESVSYHPQRYKSLRYTVQSPSDEDYRSDIERRRAESRDEAAAEERRRLRRERRARQGRF